MLPLLDGATTSHSSGHSMGGNAMLAVGLSRASISTCYRTYYRTIANLAARCHRATLRGRWVTTIRLNVSTTPTGHGRGGSLPRQSESAAELQVITRRYLTSSIVTTTDLGVGWWGKIFDDPRVAEFVPESGTLPSPS